VQQSQQLRSRSGVQIPPSRGSVFWSAVGRDQSPAVSPRLHSGSDAAVHGRPVLGGVARPQLANHLQSVNIMNLTKIREESTDRKSSVDSDVLSNTVGPNVVAGSMPSTVTSGSPRSLGAHGSLLMAPRKLSDGTLLAGNGPAGPPALARSNSPVYPPQEDVLSAAPSVRVVCIPTESSTPLSVR